MSVVVTIKTPTAIIMGSDSAVTYADESIVIRPWTKIDVVDGLVFGCCGNPDHGSLFRSFLKNEECFPQESTLDEMLDLAANFQTYLNGFGTGSQAKAGDIQSQFHVIFQNKAWSLENYYVHEINDYDAIGCGADYARTSLYLQKSGYFPTGGLAGLGPALDAACALNAFCEFPLTIYEVKENEAWKILIKDRSFTAIKEPYDLLMGSND